MQRRASTPVTATSASSRTTWGRRCTLRSGERGAGVMPHRSASCARGQAATSLPVPRDRRITNDCGGARCVARLSLCGSSYDTVMAVMSYDPVEDVVLDSTRCQDDMPDISRNTSPATSAACPGNPYATEIYTYADVSSAGGAEGRDGRVGARDAARSTKGAMDAAIRSDVLSVSPVDAAGGHLVRGVRRGLGPVRLVVPSAGRHEHLDVHCVVAKHRRDGKRGGVRRAGRGGDVDAATQGGWCPRVIRACNPSTNDSCNSNACPVNGGPINSGTFLFRLLFGPRFLSSYCSRWCFEHAGTTHCDTSTHLPASHSVSLPYKHSNTTSYQGSTIDKPGTTWD